MATYINLHGNNIPIRSSDPTNPIDGEMWYKKTTNALKRLWYATASWATSGALPQAGDTRVGLGIQTAALCIGRQNQGYQTFNNSDIYNGATWTAIPALNTNRTNGFASREGSTTAGVYAGGFFHTPSSPTMANTEEYNGASWTATNNMNQARFGTGGWGTEASMLAAGGYSWTAGTTYTNTEKYDGTCWAAVNSLNNARSGGFACGSPTAAHYFSYSATAGFQESWNGTSWSTVPATYNTAASGRTGAGTATSAWAGGSGTSPKQQCETWDGTSWATSPATLNTAGNRTNSGCGTSTAGLVFGGHPDLSATEEFTGAGPATVTITSS